MRWPASHKCSKARAPIGRRRIIAYRANIRHINNLINFNEPVAKSSSPNTTHLYKERSPAPIVQRDTSTYREHQMMGSFRWIRLSSSLVYSILLSLLILPMLTHAKFARVYKGIANDGLQSCLNDPANSFTRASITLNMNCREAFACIMQTIDNSEQSILSAGSSTLGFIPTAMTLLITVPPKYSEMAEHVWTERRHVQRRSRMIMAVQACSFLCYAICSQPSDILDEVLNGDFLLDMKLGFAF